MKQFLYDRKKLASQQRTQVLIAGRVVVPKITCLKEIKADYSPYQSVIPVALKKGMI